MKHNITIHKDSQGRAALAQAQFRVIVPFAEALIPCSPVMVGVGHDK